jgi:type I restriction enzyme S subunit
MSFPRYPKYKDSGVEWLGEVPEHWEAFPNRALFVHQKREVGAAWAQTELLSLTLRGVIPRDIESGDGKYPSDFSNYQIVKPGELVFCLFDMDETPRTVGLSSHFGMITSAYDVFECKPVILPRFVYYFYLHVDSGKRLRPFYTGLRKTVRTPTFLSVKTPLPPPSEQHAIASFLDRETAKIDALIAEQQRLIELLQEKRQAVISHAVTKGLNPDAPMKDSGCQWSRDIPKHWESIQLGRVCRDVADGPHFSPNYVDQGVLFLSARNIKVHCWDLDDVKYVSQEDCAEFDKRVVPEVGDVLYTKGGTTGVARVVDLTERFQVWVHVAVLKLRLDIADPEYIAYSLNSTGAYEQSQLFTRGATNQDLGLTRMIRIRLALPPLSEQREIVKSLQLATNSLDTMITEGKKAISLLQERRSALISAAVTGLIDVRGLAPKEAA